MTDLPLENTEQKTPGHFD